MKQLTAAPQTPTVAYARACAALAMGIVGFGVNCAPTASNFSARHLGVRTT